MHWRVFATAKPRKARPLVSVADSGLQLPLPIPIVATVVLYTAVKHNRPQRRPKARLPRRVGFWKDTVPGQISYRELATVSRGCSRP